MLEQMKFEDTNTIIYDDILLNHNDIYMTNNTTANSNFINWTMKTSYLGWVLAGAVFCVCKIYCDFAIQKSDEITMCAQNTYVSMKKKITKGLQ